MALGLQRHLLLEHPANWEPARGRHLSYRSFEALSPGGHVFLYEMLLSDGQNGPLTASLFSVSMVYLTLGKQLAGGQIGAELREGGFKDVSGKVSVATQSNRSRSAALDKSKCLTRFTVRRGTHCDCLRS